MPTVTRTSPYHVPPNFEQGGYFLIQVMDNGQQRHARIYVHDAKADKHVIETYWPAQQGNRHTGIVIDNDQFRPLYEKFGHDLITAAIARGGNAIWIELKYDHTELPGQYFTADVRTKEFSQVTSMLVGGSIGASQAAGLHVCINHGPY